MILRRVPDDQCDPLELRGDTLAGVPGLLQAVRGGNVVVANALGSGLLEAPALTGILAALCPAFDRRGLADSFGRHVVVRSR